MFLLYVNEWSHKESKLRSIKSGCCKKNHRGKETAVVYIYFNSKI